MQSPDVLLKTTKQMSFPCTGTNFRFYIDIGYEIIYTTILFLLSYVFAERTNKKMLKSFQLWSHFTNTHNLEKVVFSVFVLINSLMAFQSDKFLVLWLTENFWRNFIQLLILKGLSNGALSRMQKK